MKDKKLRREAAKRSHLFFFQAFLGEHIKYKTAPFQRKLLALAQDERIKLLVVEAFRGSAKSTIMALSYPIWSIIGVQQKKFVLILCQTQSQARQTLKNIKDELTENELLKAELGPFDEPNDEWRTSSIVIPRYEARITAVSLDTSVRGLKHGAHRPDLIICDDLEDLASVKVKENRDKLYKMFFGDLVPMGDITTKVVVIGTRLHDDSLLMRLRRGVESGALAGATCSFPLVDDNGNIAWKSKFPNMDAVEELRRTIGNIQSWSREFLLKIIDDEETVVKREWITRYATMPVMEGNPDFQFTLSGVDLAISEATTADFTAMVSISAFRDHDGKWSAYVHPYPVNERLDFPAARDRIKMVSRVLGKGTPTTVYIESVGYQASMAQDLQHDGYPAEEFKVHGQDKRTRLSMVTHLIKDSIVQFPEFEANILVDQLVGFGSERHDDLADAFAIVLFALKEKMAAPGILFPRTLPLVAENAESDAELAEVNNRYNDIYQGYLQGRIPPAQYMEAKEQWRLRRIEITTRAAKEQHRKFAEDEERRMKQYNLQMYGSLMQGRR